MANANGIFSYSLTDEVGVKGALTLPMRFADTVTLAELVTAWGAMHTLAQAITGASIGRGRISFEETVGAPPAPVADARIEQTGLFQFAISGSAHRQGIAVPAFLGSLAPLERINLAAGAVSAWTDAVSAAITGGGVYATPEGVALGAIVDAFSTTRSKRRQLRALSLAIAP